MPCRPGPARHPNRGVEGGPEAFTGRSPTGLLLRL